MEISWFSFPDSVHNLQLFLFIFSLYFLIIFVWHSFCCYTCTFLHEHLSFICTFLQSTGTEILKPKIFNLSSKTLSRHQTTILLRGSKFTPTPKRNNIELKLHAYKIIRADCDLLSFSKTKKQTILRIFFKNNLPLPHLQIGIEI